MEATHGFLLALGLDDVADRAAIRRAYARKLKLIDLETEPAAFQALREAYETALEWVDSGAPVPASAPASALATAAPTAREEGRPSPGPAVSVPMAREVSRAPAQAPEEQAPAAPVPDPAEVEEALVAAAIEGLAATADRLAATGLLEDAQAWYQTLNQQLDEEMVHLDARMRFEAHLVARLAHGWQPGNAALFVAAAEVFGWAADRPWLASFGYPGALLNEALDEYKVLHGLPPETRTVCERLVLRLRDSAPPTTSELLHRTAEVREIAGRFPVLLHVIVGKENIERWLQAFDRSSSVQKDADAPVKMWNPGSVIALVFVAYMLFSLLGSVFGFFDKPETVPPHWDIPGAYEAPAHTDVSPEVPEYEPPAPLSAT